MHSIEVFLLAGVNYNSMYEVPILDNVLDRGDAPRPSSPRRRSRRRHLQRHDRGGLRTLDVEIAVAVIFVTVIVAEIAVPASWWRSWRSTAWSSSIVPETRLVRI
jgi:hypothetical protein